MHMPEDIKDGMEQLGLSWTVEDLKQFSAWKALGPVPALWSGLVGQLQDLRSQLQDTENLAREVDRLVQQVKGLTAQISTQTAATDLLHDNAALDLMDELHQHALQLRESREKLNKLRAEAGPKVLMLPDHLRVADVEWLLSVLQHQGPSHFEQNSNLPQKQTVQGLEASPVQTPQAAAEPAPETHSFAAKQAEMPEKVEPQEAHPLVGNDAQPDPEVPDPEVVLDAGQTGPENDAEPHVTHSDSPTVEQHLVEAVTVDSTENPGSLPPETSSEIPETSGQDQHVDLKISAATLMESPVPELQALATPDLEQEVSRMLQILLPQARNEFLQLLPRSEAAWGDLEKSLKLKTYLSKLRYDNPKLDVAQYVSDWFAPCAEHAVQVIELRNPDLNGEQDLAWLVFAALIHASYKWALPEGTGKYRVHFRHPRNKERIRQCLQDAGQPVPLETLSQLLAIPADQLRPALPLLPFVEVLQGETYRLAGQKSRDEVLPAGQPAAIQVDAGWKDILEVLDPVWLTTAGKLMEAGIPAPDDCHRDLHDGVQVTEGQALLYWETPKVAVVEENLTLPEGTTVLATDPELLVRLQKALGVSGGL